MANISEQDFAEAKRLLTQTLIDLDLKNEIVTEADVIRINVTEPGFAGSDKIHDSLRSSLLYSSDLIAEVYAPLKVEVKLPGEEKLRTYAYAK